jgi:uncharacterized protein YbjT (DUF2867 family)
MITMRNRTMTVSILATVAAYVTGRPNSIGTSPGMPGQSMQARGLVNPPRASAHWQTSAARRDGSLLAYLLSPGHVRLAEAGAIVSTTVRLMQDCAGAS